MKKHPKLYNQIPQQTAIAGWTYYAFELLFLPSVLLALAARLNVGDAVVNFVYYLLNFTVILGIFKDFILESLDYAGRHMLAFLRAVLLGALTYWAVSTLMRLLLARLVPDFANVNDQSIGQMLGQHPVLMGLGVVALVPLAEECLFRGLIFSQLHSRNRVQAYCLSVLAFCAVHVTGYVGVYPAATLALCALQYIPAGLALAWAYEHCGSILAPILIHTAVNAVSVFHLLF